MVEGETGGARRDWAGTARGENLRALFHMDGNEFEALVVASSEAIYTMSPDWGEMRQLYSYRFFEPLDTPTRAWIERLVHPDDQATVRQAVGAALRTRSVVTLECRMQGRDGTFGRTRSHAVPLLDAAGEVREWLGVIEEVGEACGGEDRSGVLDTLARELRGPLEAIQLSVQLLHQHEDPYGPGQVMWNVMEREVAHVADLIHGIVDVTRLRQGVFELYRAPTDLKSLVARALDLGTAMADRSLVTLTVELPDEPVILDVDPDRLAQVLVALLDNAWKFTPAGGEVRVSAETVDDGEVKILVQDSGCGIAGERLARVSDPFWKAPEHRAGPGLGLGLHLASAIVGLHGGSLAVASDGPGKGSTFSITVPSLNPAPGAPKRAEPVVRADPVHRVLIVDDNQDLLDILALAVRQMGMEVLATTDVQNALRVVSTFDPTVVILDLGMVPLDGYQLARMIRGEDHRDAPVLVALTGWGSPADRERARAAGFSRHLVKPITIEQLHELLASIPLYA